jgi:N-dimethylarginine dimethylaminohydrolase
MPSSVLLCPPTYFEVRDRKNPHMGGVVDSARAQEQWEALRNTLQSVGVRVETIDPVPGLEDMVFAANQVFVGSHPTVGKFIVPSEMRFHSRQREVPYYVEWFSRHGYKVLALNLVGECLEGHGDLIWHPDKSRIWAGYGFRSTKVAVDHFTNLMRQFQLPVTPLRLIDEFCYHLDTCFAPLNREAALVYPEAFSPDSLDVIRAGFQRVHELTREETLHFMCNGIVANGRYITPRLSSNLERYLRSEGLEPMLIDTSEFEKSGGSAFCMKAFLD